MPRAYTEPKHIADVSDCYFYHTVDLPEVGLQVGEWDLRDSIEDYLGRLDYKGKRVLDVGTANGFLCFEMEKRGANVVGYDLSEDYDWDGVPYNAVPPYEKMKDGRKHFKKMNNAFWLSRRVLNSSAQMLNGTVYNIPQDIEKFDVSVFGSILLHVRDPFLALQNAAGVTKKHIVVTDVFSETTRFIPDPEKGTLDTWWHFSPELIVQFLRVLGFHRCDVYFHDQRFMVTNESVQMFTVVASR